MRKRFFIAAKKLMAQVNQIEEIERKWLISALPDISHLHTPEKIQQGYLIGNPIKPRLRSSKFLNLTDTIYFLTLKGKGMLKRAELETQIRHELFEAMWIYTKDVNLRKTRYHDPCGERTAEIDKYHDKLAGLLTIEMEFPTDDEATAFVPPSWWNVIREITDDPRFKNENLALDGWNPEWLKK